MDDGGGGRRGRRAERSPNLDVVLEVNWGVRCAGSKAPDLGGASSLNLLVTDGLSQYVARIYRPLVTAERLAILQRARSHLTSYGVPTVEPIPTRAGEPWVKFENRLVELEPFVASTHRMDDLDRVQRALPLLGRLHLALSELDAASDGSAPVFSNYLPLQDLADSVSVGTRRIRAWNPTEREAELADLADRLVESVLDLELRLGLRRPEQLVHRDFWDNNVLFVGDDVVLVTDFDFLGPRPRVDDLALTLYFVSLDVDDLSRDDDRLWTLVDAYESGLDRALAEEEREALPIAMARQPLWSIGVGSRSSTTKPPLVGTLPGPRPPWSGDCNSQRRLQVGRAPAPGGNWPRLPSLFCRLTPLGTRSHYQAVSDTGHELNPRSSQLSLSVLSERRRLHALPRKIAAGIVKGTDVVDEGKDMDALERYRCTH